MENCDLLWQSKDPVVKSVVTTVKSVRKWKAKQAVHQAQAALEHKDRPCSEWVWWLRPGYCETHVG